MASRAPRRRTDPINSYAAADTVNLNRLEHLVIQALSLEPFPLCYDALINLINSPFHQGSPSGIRSRCKELRDKGFVIEVGDILVGSRKHAVYTLSNAGYDLARAYGYRVVRKVMTDAAAIAAWHAQYGVQARPYLGEGV